MRLLGRAAGIRVVNYERSALRNALIFSSGPPANLLQVDHLWRPLAERALTGGEDLLVSGFLAGRRRGEDNNLHYGEKEQVDWFADPRPVLLLFTNISWDSTVVRQQGVFADPPQWLRATVEFFRTHPQYRLLIRIHPGEVKLRHDPTRDSLEDYLRRVVRLPENVDLIPAAAPVDSYDLMESARGGAVFTTTAGLEMAALGKPVIVVGEPHYGKHGFTLEAVSPVHYEELLLRVLEQSPDAVETKERARRARSYIYAAFLAYSIPFPWVDEYTYGQGRTRWLPRTLKELEEEEPARRLADYLLTGAEIPCSVAEWELRGVASRLDNNYHLQKKVPPSHNRRPEISVLIPTHRRPEDLERVLDGYCAQSLSRELFEIVVVCDGPQEETREILEKFRNACA